MTRLEVLKHRVSHCKTATELQRLLENKFGCETCSRQDSINCCPGMCIGGHDDYYSKEWSK